MFSLILYLKIITVSHSMDIVILVDNQFLDIVTDFEGGNHNSRMCLTFCNKEAIIWWSLKRATFQMLEVSLKFELKLKPKRWDGSLKGRNQGLTDITFWIRYLALYVCATFYNSGLMNCSSFFLRTLYNERWHFGYCFVYWSVASIWVLSNF